MAATSGSPVLRHCVKQLMPGMIHYIAGVAAGLDDDDAGRDVHVNGVDEILKAFLAFYTSVPEEHRMCCSAS